jgi:SNF2 family DNA or RNA helicase
MERTTVAAWISSRASARRQAESILRVDDPRRPRVLLMNVEALSTVSRARDLCHEFLGQRPTMMVVDESTRIKSPTAKRTRYALRLGQQARWRRILSGLPTPRSPLDIYSQFEFLDPRILGHRSFYGFRARYAIMRTMQFGGRSVQVVVGYRNTEELQERIAPHSFRRLKEECLDLPPKIFEIRDVPLTEEQRRMYGEMREFATTSLGESHVTATAVITQIQRLHQITCGHVRDELGVVHDVPTNRVQALVDLLEEHSGKAVIWTGYQHSLRAIASRLRAEYGDEAVVEFWGETSAEERQTANRRFQHDPTCRFMVSNQQTGGTGNNWQAASLVVYYSNTYSLEDRLQSEDRAHRSGLRHAVTYVDLRSPGTVDEKIVKALREKIDLAATITGDNYREWLI